MLDTEFYGGEASICVTCGTQFAPSAQAPAECPIICLDPRQYVGFDGQQWTTLDRLRAGHSNVIEHEEPGLSSIRTEPSFGIGERAFLLQTPQGNVLWDCVALLNQPTVEAISRLGGIAAIAISHPHYYTTMVEWSVSFDNAPIYLHAADRDWVMRPHANIRFWQGNSLKLLDDLVLVHTPGHFDGFQVLHWPAGADGKGVLLAGDQPQVCMDRRWLSFLYSYPNYLPLGILAVENIGRTLELYDFDRIYGAFPAFPRRTVRSDAKETLKRSLERYAKAVGA